MLFNPKHKKVLEIAFIIVSVLIVISMILLYFPALSYK
jgi:predicted nucleic acid-binding Zn ribbon protein